MPIQVIDADAEKGCDLIAMLSHSRHGVSAVVLGSETVKVPTYSKNPRPRLSLRSPALRRGARFRRWSGPRCATPPRRSRDRAARP